MAKSQMEKLHPTMPELEHYPQPNKEQCLHHIETSHLLLG